MSHRPGPRLDVHLDAIEQLANDSPFDCRRRWVFEDPAIDYLADELRGQRRLKDLEVVVYLPPEVVARKETDKLVRSTIDLYCRAWHRHLDNEIGGLARQAMHTFWIGFGILGLAILAVFMIEHTTVIPTVLSEYLTEGLYIIGWVAAWFPIDMALYSRWPLYRDKRIYAALRDAKVQIKAEKYIVDSVTGDIRGLTSVA